MSSAERVLLAWSSGKDSAFSLHVLRAQGAEVVGLLTTINETFGRVAMHAVRVELVRAQAAAAGLPLLEVPIPWPCSNEAYEAAMGSALATARAGGATAVAFGDLFLEDVRRYREDRMAPTGLAPLFPLWGRQTRALAEEMIASGQRAILTCVDPHALPPSFIGRDFDEALLRELPVTADPCGERGEFHTFAWDGPAFRQPVPVRRGDVVERDGFVFADLQPGTDVAPGRVATARGTDGRPATDADPSPPASAHPPRTSGSRGACTPRRAEPHA